MVKWKCYHWVMQGGRQVEIQIQMIGTGNAFAKKYFNNNAIVSANGSRLLIDCGVTAPYALHQLSVSPADLEGILITHIHGDHIGGLEEIAFRMKYVHQRKLKLFVPAALQKPLWEESLKGAMEDHSANCDSLSSYFDVVPLEAGQPVAVFDGLTVELVATKHVPNKPSFAVLLNESVFYSSDMTFDPDLLIGLIDAGRCGHILHDCQLRGYGAVHTTLSELLTLPDRVQDNLWLMHYEDGRDEFIGKTGRMRFIEQHQVYRFG